MGLFQRFLGPKQAPFHSSGVTASNTVGSASTSTFSQRQSVDQNRQHVGGYRDAGLNYSYRKEALGALNAAHRKDPAAGPGGSTQQPASPSEAQSSPLRSEVRRTSRIDIVKQASSGQAPAFNDGRPHPSQVSVQRPSFSEPSARGYNPYR